MKRRRQGRGGGRGEGGKEREGGGGRREVGGNILHCDIRKDALKVIQELARPRLKSMKV